MSLRTSTFTCSSIREGIEIIVDRWGVPHIYAANRHDVFFAQGFNIARDRLWQLDFWRRRGLGCLSEVFGERLIERDRCARLFLFRGDWEAEWASYGPNGREIVTAFVEGINHYVTLTLEGSVAMPPEFREVGYLPDRWRPEDVVRIRSHGVFGNLREEVLRVLALRDAGPAAEDLRRCREPNLPVGLPEDLDVAGLGLHVLRDFDLATKPVDFNTEDTLPPAGSQLRDCSNNWVISAERSATGRPVLANDPHRTTTVIPSLRYICHLATPEINVIGAGEPCIPGVSIGHNGKIAFGLTTFSIDQEDLFVLVLHATDDDRYRWKDDWLRLEQVQETIPVAGGPDHVVELLFSRCGPVIHVDRARRQAYAVKAAWLEPGMAPYLGSLDCMMQQNFAEFGGALQNWGAPPLNIVWCDQDNIGWQAVGLAPIRDGWDGTVPVAGTGRYEWLGYRAGSELPSLHNPTQGYIATANEMNVPEGDVEKLELGFDWYAPYRRERIGEVLESYERVPFAVSAELQNDVESIPARRLLGCLKEHLNDADFWRLPGFSRLVGWDCVLDKNSVEASIFEVWYRRHFRSSLRVAALTNLAPDCDGEAFVSRFAANEDLLADARVDLAILQRPDRYLGPDHLDRLRAIASGSMESALEELRDRLGDDAQAWHWGQLHVAEMVHPLTSYFSNPIKDNVKVGPAPRGGSGDTVCATAYRADFVQSGGATFKMVLDVGDWDNSLVLNSPGQSGDPESEHFADLFDDWIEGKMFPLLYSKQAVIDAASQRILIKKTPQ